MDVWQELSVVWYGIFWATKIFLYAFDTILDLLTGYSVTMGSREERAQSQDYGKSAHLVTIVARGGFSTILDHEAHNFLWLHQCYLSPENILLDKNVVMYAMTTTHAYFTMTEEDLYNVEKYPFIFIAQYKRAKQLIIVPHSTLHRLADKVGDPALFTFVNMTARCGSTLLCQVMYCVPGVRAISEPYGLVHLHGLYVRKQIKMNQYRLLLKSYIRLLCKLERNDEPQNIFVKGISLSGVGTHLLRELFPECNLIYNTRNMRPSLESLMKVMMKQSTMARVLPWAMSKLYKEHAAVPYDDEKWEKYRQTMHWLNPKVSIASRLAFNFAGQTVDFLRHQDDYQMVIIFDDLVSKPELVVGQLLDLMGIPEEHLSSALKALRRDSQKGIFGQRKEKASITEMECDRIGVMLEKSLNSPVGLHTTQEEFKKMILGLGANTY